MSKGVAYYEYLSQDRIRNMYQQIGRSRWLRLPRLLGLDVQALPLPTIRFTAGQAAEGERDVTSQLEAVLSYLKKRQADKIGTIDEPRTYIGGTLPMFSYFLPQGYGARLGAPRQLIYYGGATDSTILGLAGPVQNVVGSPQVGGQMSPLSSAMPHLTAVLASEYRLQTPYKKRQYHDEGLALSCIRYFEEYNREGVQVRNYAFLATVKLDSRQMRGWLERGRRIILASPLYVALAD